ncbi:SPASM domain-containing protein [Carboxylicivirga sp. M1479]|uniref:SPASM domain-containing protein n=1 Tax=uncultured Carboxylicivirga sp. TaxID=1628156 RepID=UPI002102CD72|nr:SPASM domain-containing protein [Carboxylicivirga sp. M1479]
MLVGNINDKHIWSNHQLNAQYSMGIDHYQDPVCRDCSFLPICRGGCPKRRYENKYEGKQNDCCTPFKGRIEDYLELIVKKQD